MAPVLFCPFCRESFEGEKLCPEHELSLVPWNDLPKPPRPDDEQLAWWSPAFGRGLLAAGAFGTLVAFATLPLATTSVGAVHFGGSLLKLALFGSPKLWLVPTGALTLLAMLGRRLTPVSLRRARVAALVAALVPPAGALWALEGAREAIAALSGARDLGGSELRIGLGVYALIACAVVSCIAALRLGGPPPR